MSRRKRNRRKKVIVAYVARIIFVLILATMLFLMGCGCLYIREHFFSKDKGTVSQEKGENEGTEVTPPTSDPDNSAPDSDETAPTAYEFTYPDASGMHIVLDAGHGETDGGSLGVISEDVIEKDINLAIVMKMKQYLEECGAKVTLTRKADDWVTLSDRTYVSNKSGADLFVSIHCNSFEDDPSINGLEIYHHNKSETSKDYAEKMLAYIESTKQLNVRYVLAENLQVLRDNSIPAVMVELGYLSNPEDCRNLSNSLYQDTIAKIVVDAIVNANK